MPAMKMPEGTNLALKLAEVRAANERLKREAELLKAAAATAEAVKKAAVVAVPAAVQDGDALLQQCVVPRAPVEVQSGEELRKVRLLQLLREGGRRWRHWLATCVCGS